MRYKNLLPWILITVLSMTILWGKEIEITLETAKKIALENNPDIRVAKKELKQAELRLVEARANFFPTISAFSQLQHAWELPTVIMNNPFYDPVLNPRKKLYFKMGTENNIAYGLNLQLPIFTGGSIYYGYKMALMNREIAEAQLKSKEQEVISNVINAYYNVLFLQSMLKVTEEALEAATENLKQVKYYYNEGKASEFDLIRAEVQLENYKPQLLSVKNQIRIAKDRLKMLLGIDDSVEIICIDSLYYQETEFLKKPLEELIENAIDNRADIKILKIQKDLLKTQVKLNRASLMPTLAFSTNYQYQGQKDDFNFESEDFFRSSSSSLSLSIPLFSGFKNHSRIQQSKVEVRKFQDRFDHVINGVKIEVKSAWLKLKEAAQNVQTQLKIVEQSKESMRLANLMYKEGMNTQLDVLNAQVALNQSKMNYQRYLLEYNLALASLLKALNLL